MLQRGDVKRRTHVSTDAAALAVDLPQLDLGVHAR